MYTLREQDRSFCISLQEMALSAARVGLVAAQNWFVPFLAAAMALYHLTVDNAEKMPTNRRRLFKEYDFIVVGEFRL